MYSNLLQAAIWPTKYCKWPNVYIFRRCPSFVLQHICSATRRIRPSVPGVFHCLSYLHFIILITNVNWCSSFKRALLKDAYNVNNGQNKRCSATEVVSFEMCADSNQPWSWACLHQAAAFTEKVPVKFTIAHLYNSIRDPAEGRHTLSYFKTL